MAPYDRETNEPFGILKVIGGGTLSFTAETEDLFGGSQKFAFASEIKTIDSSFVATVKSLPDFLFEKFLAASVSTTAASSGGTVSAVSNKKGTSVVDAVTGITATLTIDTPADLKNALYVVKAVSATTVDVFALTDIDFGSGTALAFDDDLLKITSSPLTITMAGSTAIPGTGLSLNGGSGTIALVTDDTAIFRATKAHGGISTIIIGKAEASFDEFGFIATAAKRADGSVFEIEAFKALATGFPLALEETVFAIPEMTVKLLFDDVLNKVAEITATAG